MTNRKDFPTKLLWMDLEFTGFDYNKDVIIEVYVKITDFDFNELGSYEELIKNDKNLLLERMALNPFWQEYPENRQKFLEQSSRGKNVHVVEKRLLDMINSSFGDEVAILAGNSIHSDRRMINRWWPSLDKRLHYRMLDVSALKVFMQGKYGVEYQKKNTHRAHEDVNESIAELKYYLETLRGVGVA